MSGGSSSILPEQVPGPPHGESPQTFAAAQQPRTSKDHNEHILWKESLEKIITMNTFFERNLKRIICRTLPESSRSLPHRPHQEVKAKHHNHHHHHHHQDHHNQRHHHNHHHHYQRHHHRRHPGHPNNNSEHPTNSGRPASASGVDGGSYR